MEINPDSVFISRALQPDSFFKNALEKRGLRVEARALVELSQATFTEPPETDWLLFAGPNGVRFFMDGLRSAGLPIPQARWAAIGPATGAALEARNVACAFVGDGSPESVAVQLTPKVQGMRVLMPGPRHPAGTLHRLLSPYANLQTLVVYENRPVQQPLLSRASVLVFTSPLNAKAYFAAHFLLPGQKVVAIGNTTASALAQLGIRELRVASRPNEEELVGATLTYGFL